MSILNQKNKDIAYISGVVATKDKTLLREKLARMCELSPDEALRLLTESGFGGGAEGVLSAYDYEKLIAAEQKGLDDFIREYAPSDNERVYLLAPHDFHNAKALFKAKVLACDPQPLLGPEGLVSVETLSDAMAKADYSALNPFLKKAFEEADKLYEEKEGAVGGVEAGIIFERAMYACLADAVKHNRALKPILAYRADVTNLLTAMRATSQKQAEELYVTGGKLSPKQLGVIFSDDADGVQKAFKGTVYAAFVDDMLEAKKSKLPYTAAEKKAACAEIDAFEKYRYNMEYDHPFLYYVFRRRAEIADVRIIFVCLLAGMNQAEIKRRRRTN